MKLEFFIIKPGAKEVERRIYTYHNSPAFNSRIIKPLLKTDMLSVFINVVVILLFY